MKQEVKHILIILSVFVLLTMVILGMNFLVNHENKVVEKEVKKEVTFCNSKLAEDAGYVRVVDDFGIVSCIKK